MSPSSSNMAARWRSAHLRQRALAVILCMMAAILVPACDSEATAAESSAACDRFADLAIAELPSGEELGAEARAERVSFLKEFCADSLEEGEPLTAKESTCIQEADSLEEIAACRQGDSLIDRLSL